MKGLDVLDKKMPMQLSDESDDSDSSEGAASDILSAIASKDAKALDLALQRHYACCEGEEPDEDDAAEEA